MSYKTSRKLNRTLCAASAIVLALAMSTPSFAQAEDARAFNIEAQPLSQALLEFSRQSKVNVIAPSSVTRGLTSEPVLGDLPPQEALKVMLGDAGLGMTVQPNGAIILTQLDVETPADSREGPFRVAQLAQEEDIREVELSDEVEAQEDVIIVTGTNIRGVENPTVPILKFDAEYFEQSGYATTGEFFRDLPQNFAELSPGTSGVVAVTGASFNSQQSTGIDLRGLGADATLVLMNGRRLVPSGSNTSVDISLIPLSAIERVDILTDGGSAIYGSDAVGGVVNFILKDDYEGAETSVRYSTPTRKGGGQTFTASQSLGVNWSSGNAFVAYEFSDSQNLTAIERDFSGSSDDFVLPESFDLTPSTEAQKILVNFNQQLGDRLDITAYGLYSESDSFNSRGININEGPRNNLADNKQASMALELTYDYSDAATFTIGGTYNLFDGRNISDIPNEGELSIFDTRDEAFTFDARVSGSVFQLPAGKISYAIGGEYRNQDSSFISSGDSAGISDRQQERNVTSVFGEMIVPLYGDTNRRPFFESLQLSLAARYDDISDAGSRTTPQIGLSWSPHSDLNFRASYGESFKAPRFSQQTGLASALLFTSSDPLADDGRTPYILFNGSPPPGELEPETAETFNIGFEYNPAFVENLNISASYFNIEFEDRVGRPRRGSIFSVLEREDDLAPGVVTRNPSPEEIERLLASSGNTLNLSTLGGNPFAEFSDAEAIVDERDRNIANQNVSGIDVTGRYNWDSDWGDFGIFLNVNYLLKFDQQDEPSVPVVELVDTFLNPVDLRARTGLTWKRSAFNASIFVDYVDSYENLDDGSKVDSWITSDIRLAADVGELLANSDLAQGLEVSLLIQNVFDEDPPFVDSTALLQPVGFDPINADPLGRVVALELTKRW